VQLSVIASRPYVVGHWSRKRSKAKASYGSRAWKSQLSLVPIYSWSWMVLHMVSHVAREIKGLVLVVGSAAWKQPRNQSWPWTGSDAMRAVPGFDSENQSAPWAGGGGGQGRRWSGHACMENPSFCFIYDQSRHAYKSLIFDGGKVWTGISFVNCSSSFCKVVVEC
jgi:hypothetical protein